VRSFALALLSGPPGGDGAARDAPCFARANLNRGGRPMRTVPRVPVASVLAAIALASARLAESLEPGAHPPYLVGSTLGVPIGVLPPPAIYVSSLTTYQNAYLHVDTKLRHTSTLAAFSEGLTLLWVPDLTLWGTRYGGFINQTAVVKTVTSVPPRGVTSTETGLVNTVISPLNLAWTLPNDLFVSARFSFYPPDGQYDRHNVVNIANNFWAFEPNVGISYLKNGFDLSVHLVYDIMTANNSSSAFGNAHSNYHSGNIFVGEVSVSQSFGHWRFGAVGYGVQQTHDDSAGGRTLPATQISKVGMGPLVEYNTPWVGINFYYVRDAAWKRAFGGDNFFLRATIKF
jgi:hypothetical protein